MDKVFRKMIDNNFSELNGAVVHAFIPVPQSLINEIVALALRGEKKITSLLVSVHAQNRVSLSIKTTLLPWALNLKLKLDKSVDLASYSSPKIRAWLENNRLLGSLGSLFNALPEGIKLYGNQVVVDIGAFLDTPEEKRILDLVKSIDMRTEEGRLLLDLHMSVE